MANTLKLFLLSAVTMLTVVSFSEGFAIEVDQLKAKLLPERLIDKEEEVGLPTQDIVDPKNEFDTRLISPVVKPQVYQCLEVDSNGDFVLNLECLEIL